MKIVKVENGLKFKNTSGTLLVMTSPKGEAIRLAANEVLNLEGTKQTVLDQFYDLRRAVGAGLLTQSVDRKVGKKEPKEPNLFDDKEKKDG